MKKKIWFVFVISLLAGCVFSCLVDRVKFESKTINKEE
jgi:hypothetical protein